MRTTEPAGFTVRAVAACIDTVLMLLLTVPLMALAYGERVARIDDTRPWSLAINWLLPCVLGLAFWSTLGATPGKVLMSLTIIDVRTGRPPSLWRAMLRWLGYAVSTAPLGLGFLWTILDSERRGWHDLLSGTRVVQPRRTASQGYFAAHWHGNLSLPVSFWINNILLSVPIGLALAGLTAWISLKGEMLQTSSIATLVGWPLMLGIDAWCIVGAWRAAARHDADGGSAVWSGAARLLLFLAALSTLSATALDFTPRIGGYIQMARGIDPIGQVEILLADDGRSVKLSGPLGMGDATRVRLALEQAPKVRIVELESPGGRVFEADRIAALIRAREAQTRAIGNCASACTLVFMAGSTRQLMPGAHLGFHRAFAGTFNPVIDHLANQELAAMYRRAGLTEDIIERTLQTPPSAMWYPDADTLAAGGMVTVPRTTLDVDLPPRASAMPADMTDALRASEVWHALEQRYPGAIVRASRRMVAARARGATDAAILVEGQRVAQELLRTLLRDTSPLAREQFVAVLSSQLRATRSAGGGACRAILSGDAGARRGLPADLVQMESEWMIAAIAQQAPRGRQHPTTALEREVIQRTLGEQAPGQLARLWGTDRQVTGGDCDAAIQLLESVQGLPVGQRQLAARLLFNGS